MPFHFFKAKQNQVLSCIFPKKYTFLLICVEGAGASHFFPMRLRLPSKKGGSYRLQLPSLIKTAFLIIMKKGMRVSYLSPIQFASKILAGVPPSPPSVRTEARLSSTAHGGSGPVLYHNFTPTTSFSLLRKIATCELETCDLKWSTL